MRRFELSRFDAGRLLTPFATCRYTDSRTWRRPTSGTRSAHRRSRSELDSETRLGGLILDSLKPRQTTSICSFPSRPRRGGSCRVRSRRRLTRRSVREGATRTSDRATMGGRRTRERDLVRLCWVSWCLGGRALCARGSYTIAGYEGVSIGSQNQHMSIHSTGRVYRSSLVI